MAVTVIGLAVALRLITDGTEAPEEPVNGILTRLLGVGTALVNKHAEDAPDDVKDEAVIRVCGYLFDMPTAARGDRFAYAWRNSGAASLVSSWVSRRLGDASDA